MSASTDVEHVPADDLELGDVVDWTNAADITTTRTFAVVTEIGKLGPRLNGPELREPRLARLGTVHEKTRFDSLIGLDAREFFHCYDGTKVIVTRPGVDDDHHEQELASPGDIHRWVSYVEGARGWEKVNTNYAHAAARVEGGDSA